MTSSTRTIEDWTKLYLEGDVESGWAGKLNLHQRDAAGHSEGENHRYALKHLVNVILPADPKYRASQRHLFEARVGDLYPEDLTAAVIWHLQRQMIERGVSRGYVNKTVGKLVGAVGKKTDAFFPWLRLRGAISSVVLADLREVCNMRHAPGVKESERTFAVPMADFLAVCRVADKQLEAMMRVQYLGCMRPGELLAMRVGDIRREKVIQSTMSPMLTLRGEGEPEAPEIWAYYPPHHKSAYRGISRRVALGPEAQEVIRENVSRIWGDPDFFEANMLPRLGDSVDVRSLWTDPVITSKRRFKTEASYTRAIKRGCERASVALFTANQIRKRALTDASARSGVHVAAQMAGHTNPRTTETFYLDRDSQQADLYATKFG